MQSSSHLFTTNDLIEPEGVWNALIALLACHSGWADTLARAFFANCSRWAVAGLAVRESIKASLASFALSADDVGFA